MCYFSFDDAELCWRSSNLSTGIPHFLWNSWQRNIPQPLGPRSVHAAQFYKSWSAFQGGNLFARCEHGFHIERWGKPDLVRSCHSSHGRARVLPGAGEAPAGWNPPRSSACSISSLSAGQASVFRAALFSGCHRECPPRQT